VAILLPLTFTMQPTRPSSAVVHLLGSAVRRRHHLGAVQHPGEPHSVATTSTAYAGAAGPRRRGAHRFVHRLVHTALSVAVLLITFLAPLVRASR